MNCNFFQSPPVAAISLQGKQRWFLVGVLLIAIALNAYNFANTAKRYQDAHSSPSSTTQLQTMSSYPAFQLVICPVASPFIVPMSNVKCGPFFDGDVNHLKPCGSYAEFVYPIFYRELRMNCTVVQVPPINPVEFQLFVVYFTSESSDHTKISPSNTITAFPVEYTIKPVNMFLDTGDISALSTELVRTEAFGILKLSYTEEDRTAVGGDIRRIHSVSYTKVSGIEFFNVTDPSATLLEIASTVGVDYTKHTIVYYYDYAVLDMLASVAAVFSATITVFSFLFPFRPLSGAVRVLRFAPAHEPWQDDMVLPFASAAASSASASYNVEKSI